MNTQEHLESRLFCLIHLREYSLHQMLSTNNPLRQDTLLVLHSEYNKDIQILMEALSIPQNLNQKLLGQYISFKDN